MYLAKDTRLGRNVAIKVLPREFSAHPDYLERFEREARAASALNHPAIITIYDTGIFESHAYIAMELVEGKNLAEIMKGDRLPLKRIVTIAAQLADGLAKAHDASIIHRDLKPENVMITPDGFLKILDFGLAKLPSSPNPDVSEIQTQTSAGAIVGTAGYMSPEQAAARAVDFRSDQFSFGSILYEMLSGRRAFRRSTTPETMTAVIRDEPEPLSLVQPPVPGPLRWLVERCHAKNPEERYASTRDLARDLQRFRDHFSEISSIADTVSPPTSATKSRHLLIALATLLAAFAAVSIVAYRLGRTPPQKPVVFRTLTYSGSDSSPAVSPNGQLVAFRSDRDGVSRIWLKQLKGGNEAAVTTGSDDFPRFSPDGTMLIFVRYDASSNTTSLYRVPLLGGEARKVIDDVVSADWSPDGQQIVFIRWKEGQGEPDSHFLIVKPDGSEARELTAIKSRQLRSVRWSHDGKFLVATSMIQGNYGNRDAIVVIDVQSKASRWIQGTFNSPTSAVWSGKDQLAYFIPQTGVNLFQVRGDSMLYIHDTESGKSNPVFWAQSAGEIMDIAGNGRIVMHSASLRENLQKIPLGNQSQAGASSWLTRGNSCNRQPAYSPDGRRILFSSNMGANLDLWEVSLESRGLRRITEDAAADWDPAYSPDGKYILWSSNRSGHFEIWMAHADGSGAQPVTKDGIDAENPAMTPDGKWIVYNSYNPDLQIRGIWKIHPDGSGGQRIAGGLTQWPEISPDGRFASFGFYKQSLNDPLTYEHVVEIETATEIPFEIQVSNRDRVGGRMRWMPDGKAIVFIDEDASGNWGLFAQDFVSGKDTRSSRRPLGGFDPDRKVDTFAISPDGSNIILAEVEVLSSLIMAENVPGVEPPKSGE